MTRHLVTSALPYANGPIHFGQLIGAYLPADVYVRWLRASGGRATVTSGAREGPDEVLFVCGTDEYGTAITINAEQEGVSYEAYVERWRGEIRRTLEAFQIDFDVWSGTSICPDHQATSQEFFRRLDENGYLLKKTSEQLYCPKDKRFLADRYIVGTCYFCGYEQARGNECPNCGQELEPLKMKVVRCKICGTTPEKRPTLHWYLDLPKLRDEKLGEWFHGHPWKPNVRAFIGNQIAQIAPRPITRDMSWGVPVPPDRAGAETGKVLYVWFDAPIGYVSFTKQWERAQRAKGKQADWKSWWQGADTRLVHFIGKDNISFHCLIFPGMLFGQKTEPPYVLPAEVPANEFYNLQGGKFSTSQRWTIPLDEFVQAYDVDAARFYLLASAPETADSEWSWPEFQSCVNAKLADKIGNLVTRVLRFIDKNFGSEIPRLAPEHEEELDRILLTECGPFGDPGVFIEGFQFRKAADQLIANAVVANVFVDRMAPWKLQKTDPARAASVLNMCCEWLALLASWMGPFMPQKSEAIWQMLGFAPDEKRWPMAFRESAPTNPKSGPWRSGRLAGRKLGTVQGLFVKIDDERIAVEIAALESRRPNVG